MEDGDSPEHLCSSSESHDGRPAAVRRRVDLGGSFVSTDRDRTRTVASDQRRNKRASVTSREKENNDDSESDESLLEVTLTPQHECDASPSVVEASRANSCRDASQGDFVVNGIERVVEVSHSNTASQEVDNSDSITDKTESTRISPSGEVNKDVQLPSLPSLPSSSSYIPPGELTQPIQEQESNALVCVTEQWKIRQHRSNKNKDGGKDSSPSDLSRDNSSSGGSSNGFFGDIDEAEYNGSIASSADLLEIYETALAAVELEQLREDIVDVIDSCVEEVSSKIGQLQEVAAKVLSSYCAVDDGAITSERVGGTEAVRGRSFSEVGHCSGITDVGSNHHTPKNDTRSSVASDCTSDSRNICSEDGDSCDRRFAAVKDYVLSANSTYRRGKGNSGGVQEQWRMSCESVDVGETIAAPRGTSANSSDDDRASTRVQFGGSEESESERRLYGRERTAGSDEEDYPKTLRKTCKSARASRRIVSRQHEIMRRTGGVVDQRVRKMGICCRNILTCVTSTVNVVSAFLDAKRVARLCLQEVTAEAGSKVFEVAEAAASVSRFSREAVTFAERAVQLNEEAGDALREAERLLDEIQFEEERGADLRKQVSAIGDEVDQIVRQASCMSLEELADKKCVLESSSGSLSLALRQVKQQSTAVENLSLRCDQILSDALQVLQKATIRSVKAIDAALKALQTFRDAN